MKIFAIRDESAQVQSDLAYLLYYEMEKRFYIELPEDADPWDTPLLLSSFLKKGETTVNAYWSGLWVQQRIIPTDRQNINQVLKDNDLESYDEFALLMLSMGRCAQDDYYLVPIEETLLPSTIQQRFLRRIEDIIPLEGYKLLVFFRDGKVRKCDLQSYFAKHNQFQILLKKPGLFSGVRMQTGGYGVTWDVQLSISDTVLYKMGKAVPLTTEDFRSFIKHNVLTAAEAAQMLGCSRQNIDDLVRRGKLHPIKATGKTTLFFKSEIAQRSWQ